MTQGTKSVSNPLDPLLGEEITRPVSISSISDPSSKTGAIDFCVVYNYRNDTVYTNDRIGQAGTYVPSYEETSEGGYEAIENPNTASAGIPVKGGVGKTYDGDVISCRMDLIEEGGKDPVSVKYPRRVFLSASQDLETESASAVKPRVSVTGDFGKDLLVDSSNLAFVDEIEEKSIYWKGADGVSGRRMGYIIEDSSSASFIVEGFVSEVRVRGRR